MKTPEREDARPIDEPVYDCMGGICDITNDWGPVHVAHARWKRKNRVKQLKRSLKRYKHGTMLPKLEALRSAYTQLQYLRKPKTTEDWTKWDFYLSQLKVLQDNIQRAIIDASMYYGEALYKSENRKEQK